MLKREVSECGNYVRERESAGLQQRSRNEVEWQRLGIDAINLATSPSITAGNADRRGPW